jgi:signal transduction histidine kinase
MSDLATSGSHLRDRDRLRSLGETGLLDSAERQALNRYARIASRVLSAPVSLVSLVDDRRQFFAAAQGLLPPWSEDRQTPLSHSFCQQVVNDRQSLVVDDARQDARVCDNPAIDDLRVEAYAGMPLCDSDGNVLGSFCVIDDQPRQWSDEELDLLRLLADAVAEEIELARRVHRAEEAESDLAEINREIAAAHQRATDNNAAVMHDLRTPLQVINAAVGSLTAHPSIQESTALSKTVEMLKRNIGQAIELVKSSGVKAAIDDLFECVDVAELVADACRDLLVDERVELVLSVKPAQVLADPMMIRRAVQNLVSNALRFAEQRIHVTVSSADGMVRIVVEDDGEGLPNEEDYDQVWALGRRFHGPRSNTGLGLAVTKQLIQALGGTVRAGPSAQGGARFELLLPEGRDSSVSD